ncbi:MAG: hypothetical protein ABSE36_15145 [Terracidiphilus sp.]|jgi:hypothetical protein
MATFTTNTEPELESQGVLASWKRIAAYFGCNVRTAKRWERERGLPVRRAPGKKSGTVFARTSELDTWLESREETQMLDSAVSKGGKVGRLAAVAQNNSKPVATTLTPPTAPDEHRAKPAWFPAPESASEGRCSSLSRSGKAAHRTCPPDITRCQSTSVSEQRHFALHRGSQFTVSEIIAIY